MSAAPEVSFPDPSEAIAKTDQVIAREGSRRSSERHLKVVSDQMMVAQTVPPTLASIEAMAKRDLADPTIEIPVVVDDIEFEVSSIEPSTSPVAQSSTSEVVSDVSKLTQSAEASEIVETGPLGLSSASKARYRNFILVGAIIGIVAAGILIMGLPGDAVAGQWMAFGYLAAFFGVVCAILGGLVAVLTDRKRVQR